MYFCSFAKYPDIKAMSTFASTMHTRKCCHICTNVYTIFIFPLQDVISALFLSKEECVTLAQVRHMDIGVQVCVIAQEVNGIYKNIIYNRIFH